LKQPYQVARTIDFATSQEDLASYDLSAFQKVKRFDHWQKRVELLIQLRLEEWSQRSTRYFYQDALRNLNFARNEDVFVYISRLLHRTGNYKESVSLTSQLQKEFKNFWTKWPEQVYIYFPRPYKETYEDVAKKLGIEESLLYGISRQESLFDPKAKSPANAFGLMQVIPPTAKEVITERKLKYDGSVREQLLNPQFNIQVGSSYVASLLKDYGGVKAHALAAYNAGPEALKNWQKNNLEEDVSLWIELVSFSETREYIKKVWRNSLVYKEIKLYEKAVALRKKKKNP
jgi:soluble lytic murein transglycosylase-like protein